jgi:hypothetical protein
MNNSNFENRVSLSRKNEDFTKIVEDLSLDYRNRDDFLQKYPNTRPYTSEVCSAGAVCIAGAFFAVGAFVIIVAGVAYGVAAGVAAWVGCVYEVARSSGCFANIDKVSYKNVV